MPNLAHPKHPQEFLPISVCGLGLGLEPQDPCPLPCLLSAFSELDHELPDGHNLSGWTQSLPLMPFLAWSFPLQVFSWLTQAQARHSLIWPNLSFLRAEPGPAQQLDNCLLHWKPLTHSFSKHLPAGHWGHRDGEGQDPTRARC